jgi:hypothetical protein
MKNLKYTFSEFVEKINESSYLDVISPDFIPHEEFHKYRWIIPSGGNWYYRIKDLRPYKVPKDPMFLDTIDTELKDIVLFLHSKKIPTTPSCAGHFDSDDKWSDVFDELNNQKKIIRNKGIKLKDPEDGKKFLLKSSNYELPWNKKSFIERARDHSKLGVLGIYDPNNMFAKKMSSSRIPNSQITKEGPITLFLTSPKTPNQLKECWSGLASALM